jgi:hypothetical protein
LVFWVLTPSMGKAKIGDFDQKGVGPAIVKGVDEEGA